jgi:hypothetical protein
VGYIKETADVVKDSLRGFTNKKKFKKLIDNMIFAIETDTVNEYFFYKYRILEDLAPFITLKKSRDIVYLRKYEKVKRYYKENFF